MRNLIRFPQEQPVQA